MKLCKEICNPQTCRTPCSAGEQLREAFKSPKCGDNCAWIKQGINGKIPCKDVSCPIENIIVEFKNKQ